jgi:hypothetical protein
VHKFASYITQEISNVDKFGSSDEDDDEEDDDDDDSFTTAASTSGEPAPPPPLPLNIKRAQHRSQIEDAEKEAERMGNFDVSGWSQTQFWWRS